MMFEFMHSAIFGDRKIFESSCYLLFGKQAFGSGKIDLLIFRVSLSRFVANIRRGGVFGPSVGDCFEGVSFRCHEPGCQYKRFGAAFLDGCRKILLAGSGKDDEVALFIIGPFGVRID